MGRRTQQKGRSSSSSSEDDGPPPPPPRPSPAAAAAAPAPAPVAGRTLAESCRYGRPSYWDGRYASSSTSSSLPFEWYCEPSALLPILSRFCLGKGGVDGGSGQKRQEGQREEGQRQKREEGQRRRQKERRRSVLVVGCGNSDLGPAIAYDGRFGDVHCVDFSRVVIDQMRDKHGRRGRGGDGDGDGGTPAGAALTWTQMDCLDMPLSDGTYNLVVDKGTLDCVLCADDGIDERAARYVSEVERVLRTTDEAGKSSSLEAYYVAVSAFPPQKVLHLLECDDERSREFVSFDCEVLTVPKPTMSSSETGREGTRTAAPRKSLLDDVYFVYVCRKDPVKAGRKEERREAASRKREERRMIKWSEMSAKRKLPVSNLMNESELSKGAAA